MPVLTEHMLNMTILDHPIRDEHFRLQKDISSICIELAQASQHMQENTKFHFPLKRIPILASTKSHTLTRYQKKSTKGTKKHAYLISPPPSATQTQPACYNIRQKT
jgi:hypothetical protein